MRSLEQLDLALPDLAGGTRCPQRVAKIIAPLAPRSTSRDDAHETMVGQALRLPHNEMATGAVALQLRARDLLIANGAARIASDVRVQWNPRLKTCAGRADYRGKLISLNPRLHDHPGEIERTFLHELAHLLAQFRAGRRRILPHGPPWRAACADLGIAGEKRCHTLPFPIRQRLRKFLYRCPNCARNFPRARPIRRAIACLACCRAHNGGDFDPRFRLRLVNT